MAILNWHKEIENDQLHDPKDFSAASKGDMMWKDGLNNLEWLQLPIFPACISLVDASATPPTEINGDIYVLIDSTSVDAAWDGAAMNDWVRYDSSSDVWENITPSSGVVIVEKTSNQLYQFDSSSDSWTLAGSSISLPIDLTSGVTGVLPIANGGTNLSSIGSALQVLRVNAGATALEYATLSSSNLGTADLTSADNARTFTLKSGYTTSQYFQIQNTGGENFIKFLGDGTIEARGQYRFNAASNGGQELYVIRARSYGGFEKVRVQAEDNQGIIDIWGNQSYQLISLNSTSTSYFYNALAIGVDTAGAKFHLKGTGTGTSITFLQEGSDGVDKNYIYDNGRLVQNLTSSVISDSDLIANSVNFYTDGTSVKARYKNNGGTASDLNFGAYEWATFTYAEGGALSYQIIGPVDHDTFSNAMGFMVPEACTLDEVSVILGSSSAAASETLTFTVRKLAVGTGNTGSVSAYSLGAGSSVTTVDFVSGGALGSAYYRNQANTNLGISLSAGDVLFVESSNFAFWSVTDVLIKIKVRTN